MVSSFSNAKVLLFDLDAQMSLTQAIALNEDGYTLESRFYKWYEESIEKRNTIFDALDKYARPAQHFDFPVGYDFIYKITNDLHFVPSVEDLYWMELEVFDRESVKEFIRRLLGKITNAARLQDYDYVLFDCPPSFTLLSYSVLSCCDLILIPVNPDYFASKGTNLILNSLKMRIEPFPLPQIGVFMNKTKTWMGLQLKRQDSICEKTKEFAMVQPNHRILGHNFLNRGFLRGLGLKEPLPLEVCRKN